MDPYSDNEEDGADQGWEHQELSGVTGRVILIDVSSSDKQLSVSLSATSALLRLMLIDFPTHLIGLVLYGTKFSNFCGLDNLHKIFELNQPTIAEVSALKELCSNIDQRKVDWGIADDYNFGHALSAASQMFSHCKKKKSVQTVTIMSHFSEPDPANHQTILNIVSDLLSCNININLINVSDQALPHKTFYERLGRLISKDSNVEWNLPAPLMSVEDILSLILQNLNQKLVSAKLKLHLGDDAILEVRLYYLCSAKKLPKPIPLSNKTKERVKWASRDTSFKDTKMGVLSILNEPCMYYQCGGRRIELTEGELKHLKNFGGAPCIKLLGFKSSSKLYITKQYLKQCAFLYPEEVMFSMKLFQCLRDRCIAKDRVAICSMVPRCNSYPRLIALVPKELTIKNGRQIQSDGFQVIYLPYIDNMKTMKDITVQPSMVSEQQLNCMREIITRLKEDYSTNTFQNPELQTYYKIIEDLALKEKKTELYEDTTQPDLDKQEEKISDLIEGFINLFGPFGAKPLKRKSSAEGVAPKRKSKEPETGLDLEMLKARVADQDVGEYNVKQLRQILKWLFQNNLLPSVPITKLKKEELVNLVYKYHKFSLK